MLNKLSLPVGIENIGAYAFSECSLLSSVIIPNNFVRIGGAAFSRTGLTSVEVPEGITSIESSTFYLCEKLKTVSLPESLHSIRSDAFRQCKTLESIRISENVDSIGSNSFQGCIGLKEVVIQGGNTDLVIEWGTFGDCGFEDIVLPDRVETITVLKTAFNSSERICLETKVQSVHKVLNNADNRPSYYYVDTMG